MDNSDIEFKKHMDKIRNSCESIGVSLSDLSDKDIISNASGITKHLPLPTFCEILKGEGRKRT